MARVVYVNFNLVHLGVHALKLLHHVLNSLRQTIGACPAAAAESEAAQRRRWRRRHYIMLIKNLKQHASAAIISAAKHILLFRPAGRNVCGECVRRAKILRNLSRLH
jgi:ADP-heptose:LPS heptosyltransferase